MRPKMIDYSVLQMEIIFWIWGYLEYSADSYVNLSSNAQVSINKLDSLLYQNNSLHIIVQGANLMRGLYL